MNGRTVAIGLVLSVLAATWILTAPVVGLPAGITGSTGPSMGDDGLVLNVWVDAEPEVGDVIIFDSHDTGLSNDRSVHRIVDETDEGFVTKGDANHYVDQELDGVEPVSNNKIVGVVVVRAPIPGSGYSSNS